MECLRTKEKKKNPTIPTILRINKYAKDLARNIKIQFGLLHTTCPLRGNEEIVGISGRVKIRMRISDDGECKRKLADLNLIPVDEYLDTALEEVGIWSLEFKHDETENKIPTNAYSGYIALDQICRGSVEIREGWKSLHESRRNHVEILRWMMEAIDKHRCARQIPWIIPENRGLQDGAVKGLCS